MSQSTHQIAIKGKDETASAFKSVQNRAKATSSAISSIMGGAMAAASAFLGYRAISGTVQELGKLSDLAMKSGTSVNFLTSAATAFQVAGLDISVESLARSFQYLQKNTGKNGEGGFYEVVRSIAAIEDPIQRNAELIKNFGRQGLELMPLVNGGQELIDKFETLRRIMPGASDAAAQVGDEIADSMKIAGQGVQTLWQKVLGKLFGLFAEDFPGGVRAGALNAVNAIEYAVKKAWYVFDNYRRKIAHYITFAWETLTGGNADGSASRDLRNKLAIDADIYAKQMAANEKMREDFKADLAKLDVNDLANLFGKRGATQMGEEMGEAAARSMKRINNQLIMGESNAARRLSILGPDYQNEQKKQTKALEDIKGILTDIKDADAEVQQIAATDLGL